MRITHILYKYCKDLLLLQYNKFAREAVLKLESKQYWQTINRKNKNAKNQNSGKLTLKWTVLPNHGIEICSKTT
jgi:hypothetical protein